MVEPQLPDDAWIEVFKYLSVEDRVKHVQFTSRKFHKLCLDSRLCNSLDFRKAIFMADSLCLNTLIKARACIRRLNFEGCHWFSPTLFSKFPELPSLVSLNLMNCLVSPLRLLGVLKACPNVKNLAVSLSSDDVKFLSQVKNKSPHDWPRTTLTNLQVELAKVDFEGRHRCEMQMRKMFFSSGDSHQCKLDHEDLGSSSETILKLHPMPLESSDKRIDNYCLIGYQGTVSSSPHDISKIEYLKVKYRCLYRSGTSIFLHDMGQPGKIDFVAEDVDWEGDVLEDIFDYRSEFNYSNRKRLRFYANLCVMTNLKELDMTCFKLHQDLSKFADALRQLSNLTALSMSLAPGDFTSQGVEAAFFSKLTTFPCKLQKLRVYWSRSYYSIEEAFQPIGKLVTLEVLELSVPEGDVAFLCGALKRLVRLVSFSLYVDYDHDDVPFQDYGVLVHKALKFLPNLTELKFRQGAFNIIGLEHVLAECKNLEILCLCSFRCCGENVKDIACPDVAVNMVKNLVRSLPRLHVLILSSMNFGGVVYNEVRKYCQTLHKEGRRITISCGILPKPCDEWRRGLSSRLVRTLLELPTMMKPSNSHPIFPLNFVRARCME